MILFGRQQKSAAVQRILVRRTIQYNGRTMGNKFFKVDDHTALENLLTDSTKKPVIVFKHSTACSISSARDVSRELATLTGVRHETPQVIVLRDGKAVWNASHFDVTAASVTQAVESHS